MTKRASLRSYRLWGFLAVLGALATAGPGISSPAHSERAATSGRQVEVLAKYGRLPLHFIANQGQVDRQVRFYARRGGSSFFFSREGLVLTLPETGDQGHSKAASRKAPRTGPEPVSRRKVTVRLTPLGLSPEVKVEAMEPLPGRVNYFVGNDPHKWRPNIPTYRAVVYREAYPGIDLKFYGNGRQLEYDIIVRPGADPSKVKFRCCGVRGLEVTPAGDLTLKLLGGGELVQKKPLVYQEIGGQRQLRGGRFWVHQARNGYDYGFTLATYDPGYSLIIDPVLTYSTYLGGASADEGKGIAVDGAGCAYVTGYTESTDFPTQNSYQGYQGSADVFITKLNPAGDTLVYSTYLGGAEGSDHGGAIAVDKAGCAYVTGVTKSADFPTKNPYQGYQGKEDAFVTKLNAAGNDLVYSTYLGGNDNDFGASIAVDEAGCAYVTGYTISTDFPTENPYQGDQELGDVFVTKLKPAGDALVYSTYLGGISGEGGEGIAVDGTGCAYVTGWTWSSDFPTKNAYQGFKGVIDAFVTKLNAGGNDLVYSTYLGGAGEDKGYAIAVDGDGCAYVTGDTWSTDFPTQNAYQGVFRGVCDAFITKLNPAGSDLVYSTYLGGIGGEVGRDIAVDGAGRAYVIGETDSDDFPTQNPLQGHQGLADAFITKLSAGGNTLAYSTYLGGNDNDFGASIAVDRVGCVYVTGWAYSSGFPTRNPYQKEKAGEEDAFVAKIVTPYVPLDLLLRD